MLETFDCIISYNWQDEAQVRQVYLRLKEQGVKPWLDAELGSGPWREKLQETMSQISCCLIILGEHGFGVNQKREIDAALHFETKIPGYQIIPVLLPGVKHMPLNNVFLTRPNQVRFHATLEEREPLEKLVAWVRNEKISAYADNSSPECPYRGLERFDVEHAGLFFGRNELKDTLLKTVSRVLTARDTRRFLAVEGASGSGKSSVARAGLLAGLKNGALQNSEHWRTCIVQPGSDPLYSLAVQVGGALGQDTKTVLSLKAELSASAEALKVHWDLNLAHEPAYVRFVLLVDQFEALYTTCKDEKARQAFIDNLLHASAAERGLVLIAVRADFVGQCGAHAELARAMSDGAVLVGPMSDAELRQAIERPAVMKHCSFEGGLVDQLLSDVRKQPGNLPLLQFALKELWQKKQGTELTLEAYRDIGGVQGSLEKHAERVLAGFSGPQQEIARRLFLRLTNPGEGTEDTRRRVPFAEVLPALGSGQDVKEVILALSDWETRLLIVDKQQDQEGAFVEVAHEALIRGWPTLRKWIDADRSGRRTQQRLTEAARGWESNCRDASFLDGGTRLAVANEWAESHRAELNPLEAEFLSASMAAERKHRADEVAEANSRAALERGRLRLTIALSATLLLASVGVVWVIQDQAERQQEREKVIGETELAVNEGLTKAELLAEQARKMPSLNSAEAAATLVVWQQADDTLAQAEVVLNTGPANDDLRHRVAAMRARVEKGRQQTEHEQVRALRKEQLFRGLDNATMAMATSVEGQFDYAGAATKHAVAFAEFGLEVQQRQTEVLANRLRDEDSAIREALIVGLDNWAFCDRTPFRAELRAIAQAVDQNAWRREFRQAAAKGEGAELIRFSKEARRLNLPPSSLVQLAVSLMENDQPKEAQDLLRWARGRHPADFWIALEMGICLTNASKSEPVALEERIGCHRVAVALRPEASAAHLNLGIALYDKHHLDDAIAEYNKAIALDPKDAKAHFSLGVALYVKHRLDDAIAEYNKAITLDPNYARAHLNLGVALYDKHQLDDAIAAYNKAITLDPNYANAHFNLGLALYDKHQLDDAIAEYNKAIALDPKDAKAHSSLGVALYAKHRLDDAIAEYNKAIALDPNYANTHINLGLALEAKDQLDDAIAEFNKAIILDPKSPQAHAYLGNALQANNQLDDAIAEFNKAIALDPNYALAHSACGEALILNGQFQKAKMSTQNALNLLSAKDPLRPIVLRQRDRCDVLLALEPNLPNVLAGKTQPKDNHEWLDFIDICRYKQLHASTAKLYHDAFTADARLADDVNAGHRYNAACSAALVANGQAKDASELTDPERANLRKQALKWLRADLVAWGNMLNKDAEKTWHLAQVRMNQTQHDTDLISVRDPKALAKLPPDERDAWQELWRDVGTLLAKTLEKKNK